MVATKHLGGHFMYSNAKIPEPFCRRTNSAAPAGNPAPASKPSAEKKQASGQQDSLPLLAFLLAELFR